jgi:hypothetical protein
MHASDTPYYLPTTENQHMCCTNNDGTCTAIATMEDRGDVLTIRGLWEKGTYFILDVRATGTDAMSYKDNDPHKVLEAAERLKRQKVSTTVY